MSVSFIYTRSDIIRDESYLRQIFTHFICFSVELCASDDAEHEAIETAGARRKLEGEVRVRVKGSALCCHLF